MGRQRTGCSSMLWKRRMVKLLVIAVLLAATAGIGRRMLTKEETQIARKTSSKTVKVENKGCESMETNPLTTQEYPDIEAAVDKYFQSMAGKSGFVESYDGVISYIKLGKYKDTYVVFARYDMKIKDVYTEVPGLGTLYVDKDDGGGYRVSAKIEDEELRTYIEGIAQHEDVQALLTDTQNAYHAAVESDALLQEALADLKNAYEDSTGS